MDSKRRLEELFARFPGIGPRQAKRFVYYIQSKPASTAKEIADLIVEVKRSTAECAECRRFFMGNVSLHAVCPICSDPSRDRSSLMIVARDSDFETIERSGAYRGLYFVLGGTAPILDKDPGSKIRLKELLDRAKRMDGALTEAIVSLNATPEGENTADIVRHALLRAYPALKVTLLGRGLSTGSELEYADPDTIKGALENRR